MKLLSNIITNRSSFKILLPENLSIGQIIFYRLKLHGKNTAQVHWKTGEEITFENILEKSCRLAIHLKEQGVKEGDRISICSENHLNFSVPTCASFFLGATICPVNPLFSNKELQRSFGITKPKYIFATPLSIKSVQEAVKQLSASPEIVLLSNSQDSDLPILSSLIKPMKKSEVNQFRPEEVNNENVSCIMCSSGTTGLPKGVELTESNFREGLRIFSDPELKLNEVDKVSLGLLPFFHVYAFSCLLSWFILGVKAILLPRFEETSFLETIQKYRIQRLHLVPPLMVFLAKHPLIEQYDLSSVDSVMCGAASISKPVQELVMKRLKIKNIQQGYGLTETSAILARPPGFSKLASVGVVVPGVSAKVIPIDDNQSDGQPLGPNCKGELYFKGKSIMKGYCDDEAATKATIDEEGWLHTGDVGYYDEDGYFYIVDRVKELIKYKGHQVAPAELEEILLTHPDIKDAAAAGVPDEEAGELPIAFVVKQSGASIAEKEILKFVNDQVSAHKRIRAVRFIDNIPKTPSGKILRRALKNMLVSTT